MGMTIGILMATFNGARFLGAQLASIAAQTHRDWHLHVRDDGSTDATPEILAAFARAHPGRVTLHRDDHGRLGARGNFARLMGAAGEPYIAFSDQDDVWHADRLARGLARLRALEAAMAPGTPCLVHSDRRVIDAGGAERAASFWRSRGIGPSDFGALEAHYAFPVAAGSTMLLNRALLDLARPVPSGARMYDSWVELVALAFGAVAPIDAPLVDHRRHGGNATGPAADNDSARARRPLARLLRLLRNLDRQRAVYAACFDQASALLARHGGDLPEGERRRLEAFLALPDQGFPGRLRTVAATGTAPPGRGRGLVLAWLSGGVVPPAAGAWAEGLGAPAAER